MKKTSSTHSLIALCFLFVAILTVGVIIKNQPPIEASSLSNSSADQDPNFLALKVGENQFIATEEITLNSPIIGINGSLITITEAVRRGIVKSVYLTDTGAELGTDFDQIVANQQFAILVDDISSSPTIYLGAAQ